MEKFFIKDKNKKLCGVLFYERENDKWSIDIEKNIDMSLCPALLYCAIKEKKYHLDNKLSKMWVENRVVPEDRQNINDLLKSVGLTHYDISDILKITKGKCCMDDCTVEYEEVKE